MITPISDPTLRDSAPGGGGGVLLESRVGEQIGRFTVLRKIGSGGMGVVYVAYDAELDRRVAVKLLRPELSSRPVVREQLLSEAQMLAKLSHPNVLHVYDVGIYCGQIYLALEYVPGETLGEWQRGRAKDWRALVAMYRACGEGLVAAHSAGLTHRDFKPDNVLVGTDGRPRVLDFGLATPTGSSPSENGERKSGVSERRHPVGTPAYMSPEQHAGLDADARSDQFSFCASLYEALYGARPFPGGSLEELGHSVIRGPAPPPRNGTPAWLRRMVLRGLAVDPTARWPSMRALLQEIDRRTRRATELWTLYILLITLAAGMWLALRDGEAVCRGAAGRLLGVWDPERRDAAQQAVLATGVSFAAATWSRVAAALDEQAEGWVQRSNATCAASLLRGEQSLALLARRTACLDDRLREFDAFVRVLTEARPETIAAAVSAAAGLRPLSLCDNDEALLAGVARPDDPALAAAVERVRGELARVEGLERAGQFMAAMHAARAAQTAAASLGYPPLAAEAALARGRVALGLSRFPEAAEQLEAAVHAARRLRHEDVTLAATLELVRAHGGLSHYEVAEFWARLAEDELLRANDPVGPRVAWLLSRAALALGRGEPTEALALAEEALALQGPERALHPDTLRIHELLGQALFTLDRLDEALATYDRGLALAGEIFGEQHPGVVPLLDGRAMVLAKEARFDEAIAVSRRGLEINAAVFGVKHPRYAASLAQIGGFEGRRGHFDIAVEYLEQALEIRTRALGPDHPVIGETLLGLGKFEAHRGRPQAAIEANRRAIDVSTRALGPEHLSVATARMNLAVVLGSQGHNELALAMHTEAYHRLEKIFPSHHERVMMARGNRNNVLRRLGRYDEAIADYTQMVRVAEATETRQSWPMGVLAWLGDTYIERGTPALAVAPLERALAIAAEEARDDKRPTVTRALVRAATGADPGHIRASIERSLVQALWDGDVDRARARQVAEASAAALRAAGPDAARQLREIKAWLAAHPRRAVRRARGPQRPPRAGSR